MSVQVRMELVGCGCDYTPSYIFVSPHYYHLAQPFLHEASVVYIISLRYPSQKFYPLDTSLVFLPQTGTLQHQPCRLLRTISPPLSLSSSQLRAVYYRTSGGIV